MKKLYMMEIKQPIGTFYVGKMSASDIIRISKVARRESDRGHQRLLKEKRTREIALFCSDPDATFPTPVILSVNANNFIPEESPIPELHCFSYNENSQFAEILDGQHRILGIQKAEDQDFDLPIVIMFNLREEQKAYIFSTINGNQVKVDRSLIYDLFELSETRSPYKTCHQIARAMNADNKSPFYRRLKMLEKKNHSTETISQSTFVTNLCALISSNPQEDHIQMKRNKTLKGGNDNGKLVFRKYFLDDRDDIILRVLTNYFNAAAKVFQKEWDNPKQYILTKSVGFEGLISALGVLVPLGERQGDLSERHFEFVFIELRRIFEREKLDFSSTSFPSNSQSALRISKLIVDAHNTVYKQ